MAFLKTSDSIIIKATLTDKGKKLLSRGKFKIAKFTLGDDEIDYSLTYDTLQDDADWQPALRNTLPLEAYSSTLKNIRYGLNSHDSGVMYLKDHEVKEMSPDIHAHILYIPVLVKNDLLTISPTRRHNTYYVSVNDETSSQLRDPLLKATGFKFLESNDFEKCKIVVESGLQAPGPLDKSEFPVPTPQNQIDYILKKFLLDNEYVISADNRFVKNISSITPNSKFMNFPSGEKIIDFETLNEVSPVNLESPFDNHASYVTRGVRNMVFDYDAGSLSVEARSYNNISALEGPRGSVLAFNVNVDNELKVNSTGERDFRYKKFGEINKIVFSELPTKKFDYIETTIYIYGGTTNARLLVPVRLIRYAGV